MNYFERELRKIVEHCKYIRNPKYVDRAESIVPVSG